MKKLLYIFLLFTISINAQTKQLIGIASGGEIRPVTDFKGTKFNIELNQLLAFPNAKGYGKYTVGGRNGVLCRVDRLTDLGYDSGGIGSYDSEKNEYSGDLRYCLRVKEDRNIIFDVSGNITLKDYIYLSGDNYNNVSILGQTSPNGVSIRGNYIYFNNIDEIIVRFVTSRGNDGSGQDVFLFDNCKNVIIDHVTTSYGGDEQISFVGKNSDYTDNITISNCLMYESEPSHNTAGIVGNSSSSSVDSISKVSVLNNLFVNISHRFPNMQGSSHVDHYNNVIYNPLARFSRLVNYDGLKKLEVNSFNNYYKLGGATKDRSDKVTRLHKVSMDYADSIQIYASGNIVTTILEDETASNNDLFQVYQSLDEYVAGETIPTSMFSDTKLNYVDDNDFMTANEAYDYVLKYAGNYLLRDSKDLDILDQVINDTGVYPYLEPENWYYPVVRKNSRESGYDSITAGIPDTYTLPDINNTAGYSDFEIYCADLANDF